MIEELKNSLTPFSVWKHYKGGIYEVLGVIINATNDTEMVLYRNLDKKRFVRTLEDFFEQVNNEEGKTVPRFIKKDMASV